MGNDDRYVRDYQDEAAPVYARNEALRLAEKLRSDATVEAGVIRWKSNRQVPFPDAVLLAEHLGLGVDPLLCREARDRETAVFLAEYRARQASEPSAEQRAEARAAHGPGVELVDVISGRRFTT